jgi:hypothetical protein
MRTFKTIGMILGARRKPGCWKNHLRSWNVGKRNTEAAAARDAKLKPVLEAMRGKPYREIAEGLTSRNIPTPRGGDAWNAMSVMR